MLLTIPLAISNAFMAECGWNSANINWFFYRAMKITLLVTIISTTCFVFASPILLSILGSEYRLNCFYPTVVLSIFSVPYSINCCYISLLKAKFYMRKVIYINIFLSILMLIGANYSLQLGGLILLISYWGWKHTNYSFVIHIF